MGLELLGELVGDVLPLELVAMDARDHRDAGAVPERGLAPEGSGGRPLDAVPLDDQPLSHGELGGEYRLDHAVSFLAFFGAGRARPVYQARDASSTTRTLTDISWLAPPTKTPRSMGQSAKSRPCESVT